MVESLGWAAFLVAFIGTLLLMSERGYRDSIRVAWFAATLAVPAWFHLSFRSVDLGAITGVGLATVLATLFRPFEGTRSRWVILDLLLLFIVLSATISEVVNRTLIPGTIFELLRSWIFPYLLGRLCMEAWPEMKRSLPVIVVLATILAVFAIVESLIQVNLLAVVSGKKWDLLDKGEGFRWGLKRAQGTANHPIYLGLLLALTLPWLLVAGRAAGRGETPNWWRFAPLLVILAAFLTVSRSAHLAILIVLLADQFFRKPNYRVPMIAISVVGGLAFFVFREQVLDIFGAYAGEGTFGEDTVKIYGVEHDYTGTRHRDLLLDAYAEGIDRADWLGFGTQLQGMPKDPEMDIRFKSIDHYYLQHYLRYGYLGTIAFIAFAIAGAWNLGRAAWSRNGPWSELAAPMFGAFVAVALIVRGVALSFDFGAMWLFVAGIAASLQASRLAEADKIATTESRQ